MLVKKACALWMGLVLVAAANTVARADEVDDLIIEKMSACFPAG